VEPQARDMARDINSLLTMDLGVDLTSEEQVQ